MTPIKKYKNPNGSRYQIKLRIQKWDSLSKDEKLRLITKCFKIYENENKIYSFISSTLIESNGWSNLIMLQIQEAVQIIEDVKNAFH